MWDRLTSSMLMKLSVEPRHLFAKLHGVKPSQVLFYISHFFRTNVLKSNNVEAFLFYIIVSTEE